VVLGDERALLEDGLLDVAPNPRDLDRRLELGEVARLPVAADEGVELRQGGRCP